MATAKFVTRDDLLESEWDNQRKDWRRPPVEREVLKELSRRSTFNGLVRILLFAAIMVGMGIATAYVARVNIWLAIPFLYAYYFLYGFWVAIGHELQHGTAFQVKHQWINTIFLYLVQTLMWNSPRYAVVSHRLHHRYTMVRGWDPETDWPEVITTQWLRRYFRRLILQILVVGAPAALYQDVKRQVERVAGRKDWMMREHCTDEDVAAIRWESAAILAAHAAVVAVAIVFRAWELIALVTLAWQIGRPFEQFWHATKHIGRPYNVNDHRLNTRSIRVSWFIKQIFWGLDDHVDHHLYPGVPSRNLPRLHTLIEKDLPEPDNVFGCWAEMFEITKQKDADPQVEFVSIQADGSPAGAPATGD